MSKYTLLEIQDGFPFYYDLHNHCGYYRICAPISFGKSMLCFFLFAFLYNLDGLVPVKYLILFRLVFLLSPFASIKIISNEKDDEYLPCPADLHTLQQRLPYIKRHFMFQCFSLAIATPMLIYFIPAYLASGTLLNLLLSTTFESVIGEFIVNFGFFSKIKIIHCIEKGILP